MMLRWLLPLLLVVLQQPGASSQGGNDLKDIGTLYNLGVGIHDITGPVAGVNMMGYANPAQIAGGIHIRLFSRAFIMDDGINRLVFVSADLGMMGQLIKIEVIERLEKLYGDQYSYSNVILSGIHTHSGPAGFLQYLLFDITSFGFLRDSYDAIVEGIVQSIIRAHDSVVPGYLYLTHGELTDASINRSPSAYLNNPEDERARYEYDTDKTMTLLKMVAEDGSDMGVINWFAVHPTSMNNTNTLISGDNKGYASQLFEGTMNPGTVPGQGKFVAAFAQANCGDVSPNTKGPVCQNTGEPCDILTSTCDGKVHFCYASGPGDNMEESTHIIGTKQFDKAFELYNTQSLVPVSGPVQFIGQQVDMSNYTVNLADGSQNRTCTAALGFSFAAGTTDGPGAFDFTQGMTESNPFWNAIVNFIIETDPDQIICHDPKPILLDTGNYNIPYAWHPKIVEAQLGRVGQLLITAVPGEFTTMSGRRMREQLASVLTDEGIEPIVPVIAGLSNIYTQYITTFEEYAIQRYEGASTLYGPHTLTAYMQIFSDLAVAMARGESVDAGPPPPNMLDEQWDLLPGVMFDGTPLGYSFGDVIAQPYPFAYTGETVFAKFVSGHPRNDPQLGGSFLTVEKLLDDGTWKLIATDSNWNTKFAWERMSTILGTSVATVSWTIPDDTPEGTYRITHSGHFKTLIRGISSYSGVTEEFKVATMGSNTVPPQNREDITNLEEATGFLNWMRHLFGLQ
uniref:Neutral ceramidase n=1 Tax=Hirondellea gigas TaxID=1518452 RepID=A0A2P2I6J2_9CRUS